MRMQYYDIGFRLSRLVSWREKIHPEKIPRCKIATGDFCFWLISVVSRVNLAPVVAEEDTHTLEVYGDVVALVEGCGSGSTLSIKVKSACAVGEAGGAV